MRLVVSTALILVYSLFILANLYSMVMGGFSLTGSMFLALSVLAIVAISGKGGSESRFWAYVFCGLLGVCGALLVGYSIWAYTTDPPVVSNLLWVGTLFVVLAATTYWVIKTGKRPSSGKATE